MLVRMTEIWMTIHEFGHAYFMGILASNEFEEPWIDEGINSFWESRIIDYYYGKNSGMIDHPWLKIADAAIARTSYIMSDILFFFRTICDNFDRYTFECISDRRII